MPSRKEFLEYVLEQLSNLENIAYKQMMGEYIIYYKGKITAYVCDDRLLIKPTPSAEKLMPNAPHEPPYDGAKDMILCENTDDKEFLKNLFETIYPELPEPKRKDSLKIKRLAKKDIPKALKLTLDVFMEFEAPEYSEEGVEEFRKTLEDEGFVGKLKFYGAYINDELSGILAMREPQHISLFFVKAEHQGKGIGRQLFERMKRDCEVKILTVNSSPFAVKIYEKLGFTADCPERTTNGIRYIPMSYNDE